MQLSIVEGHSMEKEREETAAQEILK